MLYFFLLIDSTNLMPLIELHMKQKSYLSAVSIGIFFELFLSFIT